MRNTGFLKKCLQNVFVIVGASNFVIIQERPMIKRRLKSELKLSLTEPQLRLFSFAVFHAHYVLAGMFERLRLY